MTLSNAAARAGAALAAVAVLSACATGVKTGAEPVRPVPAGIVPSELPGEELTLQPNTSVEVKDAISSVGSQLLVSDARLWELHLQSRLVGALQVATLKRRVDPSKAADRNAVIGQVLEGRRQQIVVKGLPVWTTPNDGASRAIFVWFGSHTFAVLQLKGDGISPNQVADDLIPRLASQPAWQPLPPQAYTR